ncbi:MAG: hypothetical protein IJ785_01300 [Bacteroidales bacterium]|nr:hypothetical protein [Bacteroidales bacterium]
MKERNKSIFRLLLFAAGAVLLAQTVLLVVLGRDSEMRIALPLVLFFSEVAACAIMVFCILNPQYNRNYTLRRQNGRWRCVRETYGPDPNGLRHITAGGCTLLIALVFAVIAAAVLWPHIVTETLATIISCALVIALCILFCIVENKLRHNK